MASSEISQYLNRALKGEDSGEVELLCNTYSGEGTTLNYSTQAQRVIPDDAPLGIMVCYFIS